MSRRLFDVLFITLGQVTTDEKSNEITALPELIDTLDLKGATVTAVALHCRKSTAQAILNPAYLAQVLGMAA